MRTLAILVILPCLLQAATFTQRATGNWNSGGQTTWNEPGIPGDGDTVMCGNGMTLTIPAGYGAVVGDSPVDSSGPPVLTCAGTGVVVVNGTLTFRGPVAQTSSSWQVGAGGIIEHDSHLAAAPATANYTWEIGVDSASSDPPHLDLNGVAGNRATVRIAAGSGPAGGFTYGSTGGNYGGLLHGSYADISDWGTAALPMSVFNSNAGGAWYLDRCTVVRSGYIFERGLGAAAVFRLLGTSISGGVGRYDLDLENGWVSLNGGQRLIQNSVIGGTFKLYAGAGFVDSGFTVVNSMLGYLINDGRNRFAGWRDVFLSLLSRGTGGPGDLPAGGTVDYTYVARWGYPANPHYITMQDLPLDTTVSNMIGDGGMIFGTYTGDFVQVEIQPVSTHTLTLKHNILLPDPAGIDGGSFFNYSAYHATSPTLQVVADNNTFTVNSGFQVDGVGGEGNTFTPGLFQSVRNNIAWCSSGCPNGYIASAYNMVAVGAGSFTNADYNDEFRLNPAPYLFPGLNNANFASPNPPGPHDKAVDPAFLDTSRRMGVFGQVYLGDATAGEWNGFSGTHTFGVGDVVSHSVAGAYGGYAVNYRCTASHTQGTANSEPLNGSDWTSYWEPNSLQTIRSAILAGATYSDAAIGASGDDVVHTLIKWVQNGYSPTNLALRGAGYDGSDIGAVNTPALSVGVYATSPTQAVLSYSTSSAAACRIEVSESGSFVPLVHDVDPVLFPGADMDNRNGALNGTARRIFLVGTRSIQTAADSRHLSRALQQNKTHYYRVTCGNQIATGDFVTKILPFGATYQDLLPMNVDGTYNYPTTSTTDRDEEIVDSQTGVLIRRISLPSDNTTRSAPFPTAGGFGESCSSTTDAQGFYHCTFNDSPQGIYPNLYAIHPTTGAVRFLGAGYFFPSEIDPQGTSLNGVSGGGERVMWDPADANTAYVSLTIFATGRTTIAKWTYTGGDDPMKNVPADPPQSPHVVVDLLGGQDLKALVAAFNPAIDTTKFSCSVAGLQSHYFLIACRRGYQNTYAWEGAYDAGNGLPLGAGGDGHVIAMSPTWTHSGSRWCSDHTYEFPGNVPIYSFAVHGLSGLSSPPFDGGGPYAANMRAPMPGAHRGSLTSITLSSVWDTANWGAAPPQWASGELVSPNPDHFLQTVQPGDMFSIDSEYVMLKTKVSPSQWIVQRGVADTNPVAHAATAPVYSQCESTNSLLTSSGGYLWWDFLDSPDGNKRSDWVMNFGDHPVSRGNYRVESGYPIRTGAVTNKSTWALPPDIAVTSHPVFGGKGSPGDGNSYQKHVSMASGSDVSFFDETYFVGTSLFSAQDSSAVTHLGGNLYQYHYETGEAARNGTPIARKHAATLAKTKGRGLADISGPVATLNDTMADSYKYCVANAAGECYVSSGAGDIYFNHPALDPVHPFCTGGENGLDVPDICIGNFAALGVASMQYKIVNDTSGKLSYRPLARSFHNYEGPTQLSANLKLTYGGEWAILFVIDHLPPDSASRVLMLKVPPVPPDDGIDRGTFVPAVLNLTAPQGKGIETARVKFGYAENGDSSSYYCTSRHEACVATAATIDQDNPFSFVQTDTWAPAACTKSCSIAIPVYPLHSAYYAVEFLDAGGGTVATSLGIAMENNAVGFDSPPPVPRITVKPVSINGAASLRGPTILR